MSYYDNIKALNPLSYWRLGENSGTLAVDDMGVNAGTYINSPVLGVEGLIRNDINTAIELQRTNDQHVDLNPFLIPAEPAMSCVTMFTPSVIGSNYTLFGDMNSTGTAKYSRVTLQIRDSKWGIFLGNGSVEWFDHNIPHNLVAGMTYHIAYVIDGTSVKIYLNGELVYDRTSSVSLGTVGTHYWKIGRMGDAGSSNFAGVIDDVALFTKALTESEVQTLYTSMLYNSTPKYNLTIAHAQVDTDQYDFPVLLNVGASVGVNDFDNRYIIDASANADNLKVTWDGLSLPTRPLSVDDDFTGNDDDLPNAELWKATNYPLPTIENNSLKLEATTENTQSDMFSMYSLQGDFDIQVDIDRTDTPITNTSGFYFYVRDPVTADNFYMLDRTFASGHWEGKISKRVDAVSTTLREETAGALADSKRRITRTGTFYEAFYWDGAQWQSYLSDDLGIANPMEIGMGWYGLIDVTYSSAFADNFVLNSGNVVWPETGIESGQLFADVDRWDNVNSEGQVWINVPYLSSTQDTKIEIDFANTNPSYETMDRTDIVLNRNYFELIDDGCWIDNYQAHFAVADYPVKIDSRFALVGNFDIQVDFDNSLSVMNDEWAQVLSVNFDDNNTIAILIWSDSVNYYYRFTAYVNGVWENITNALTTDRTGKLRITRTATNVFTGYYWNGSNWIEISNITAFTDDVSVGFGRGNIGAEYAQFFFSNFLINSVDEITGYIGSTGTQPAKAVWNKNYQAVYHLTDAGGLDATRNDYDGTATDLDANNVVDFGIGKGLDFNGSTSHFNMGNVMDLGLNDLKISVKFNTNDLTETNGIFAKSKGNTQIGRYALTLEEGNVRFVLEKEDNNFNILDSATTVIIGVDYNVDLIWDRSGMCSMYINGNLDIQADWSDVVDEDYSNPCSALIGSYNDSDDCTVYNSSIYYSFEGKLKELRISNDTINDSVLQIQSKQDTLISYEVADNYSITGTVSVNNVLAQTEVRLYDRITGELTQRVLSAIDTGAYTFNGLEPETKFDVMALNGEGIIPEVQGFFTSSIDPVYKFSIKFTGL